jgi:S-DNA-T family DNA segregation ATPase FtsK/SpoIIIE
MAKRGRPVKKDADNDGVLRLVFGIAIVAIGVILALSAIGLSNGFVGEAIFESTRGIFGVGAFLLPVLVIAAGTFLVLGRLPLAPMITIGVALITLSVLALLGIASPSVGGTFGAFLGHLAADMFGVWGAIVLLLATALVGLVVAVDIMVILATLKNLFGSAKGTVETLRDKKESGEYNDTPDTTQDSEEVATQQTPSREPVVKMFNEDTKTTSKAPPIPKFDAEYNPPPLSILSEDKGKPGVGDIKANANIIKRTFLNFGISVEMDEVSIGPTVTRYAIKPAEGVRLSKIVSLQNNLELALAAHPVRLEAPIPGKSLVGIEVPNASKAMVGLGGILSAPEWSKSERPLLAAVGRDISGTPHYLNISKMPHGLVAGATGSGKSVAIHAIITSLLYRNGPNQMRFIMIDPKRVELTLYNGIPHLLTPVITDPKKCIMALKWAAKEMERRYNILEAEQVRDIDSYHKTVIEPSKKRKDEDAPDAMPYIIIVIDELADIMQSYPRELEAGIVRLAQMSRAVGIHLLLSTQRPSVNVITGLIKANVPTRMALQVASQIDSRTILDMGGAESLLGAGDMLYLSSDMQKPVRLQTAYINEQEVKKVVSYIKQHNAGSLGSLDLAPGGSSNAEPNDAIMMSNDDDADDDMYHEAKVAVEEAGRASTSYLQRKLRIGYSRAARLMDILEEKGVIGPADGSRPREVLTRGAVPPPETSEREF